MKFVAILNTDLSFYVRYRVSSFLISFFDCSLTIMNGHGQLPVWLALREGLILNQRINVFYFKGIFEIKDIQMYFWLWFFGEKNKKFLQIKKIRQSILVFFLFVSVTVFIAPMSVLIIISFYEHLSEDERESDAHGLASKSKERRYSQLFYNLFKQCTVLHSNEEK